MAHWIMSVGERYPDAWTKAKQFGEWGFSEPRGRGIAAGDTLLVHFGGDGIGAIARALGPLREVSPAVDSRRSWAQVDDQGQVIRHLYRFPMRVVAEYLESLRPAYPSRGADAEYGLHSAYLLGGLTPIDGVRFRKVVAALDALNQGVPNEVTLDDLVQPDVVRRESGESLDAHFSVRDEADGLAVFLESRGGSRGAPNYRNPDYAEGLWYILSRLASADARLLDATVESTETVNLPHDSRVLALSSPYPLDLAAQDPEVLRLEIQRAQRVIGRAPGAGPGGNNTKRIRLLVERGNRAADDLFTLLAGGAVDEVLDATRTVEVIAGRRRGQGFATDAKARKAVEERSMAVVRAALEADGWHVEDVSTKRSYDFHCTLGKDEQRIEVKGSVGGAEEVIVTPKEVEHARDRGDVWLGIVSGIVLDRDADGTLSARGGTLLWHRPWAVDDGELVPLGFKWIAPSAP